jgi:hypothetical protein
MGASPSGISERVVHEVAAAKRTEPTELPPLYEAVDPDALDACVGGMLGGEVTFQYAGCTVTADNDGRIRVRTDSVVDERGQEAVTN